MGKLALAYNFDQSCRLQLFHVVGQSGGAYLMRFLELGAGRGLIAGADLFEYLIAARLGQRAGNAGKLPVGEAAISGGPLSSNSLLDRFLFSGPLF